jgi:hypothetical protein
MLLGALFAFSAQLSIADENITDQVMHCAAVDDASLRLACYDKIGGRPDPAPIVGSMPAAPAVGTVSEPLPQKMEQKKEVEGPVLASVKRCTKDARKKYHFYLDDGQIWKQVSDKRLSFKECDFDVVISKDFFGYKMQVDGEKSRFRVTRIR